MSSKSTIETLSNAANYVYYDSYDDAIHIECTEGGGINISASLNPATGNIEFEIIILRDSPIFSALEETIDKEKA